jgi:uncharacterized protein YodC (DUF2158 family)
MNKFSTGDIVRLKSGGPTMTVDKHSEYGGDVVCQWFAGSKLSIGGFPEGALVKVEDEEEKPKR